MGQTQNARFYYSTPSPCPYLPGHVERRIFADVSGPNAVERYEMLSEAGFRRSLGFAYRPACPGCNACVPVRIPAPRFERNRGWRRVLAANQDLTVDQEPARATDEQYALFRRYQIARHGDGDMARMDGQDYRTMLEVGAIDSFLLTLRRANGDLAGVCLTDRMMNGLSAVYSFFEPDEARRYKVSGRSEAIEIAQRGDVYLVLDREQPQDGLQGTLPAARGVNGTDGPRSRRLSHTNACPTD